MIGAIGDDLKFVEETVNKVYEDMYQKVKPTFSFMRFLANIWHDEVYLNFKEGIKAGVKNNIRQYNHHTLAYAKQLVTEYKSSPADSKVKVTNPKKDQLDSSISALIDLSLNEHSVLFTSCTKA